MWVFIIDLPVLILNDIPIDNVALNWVDLIGYSLWVIGFIIEVLADA